MQPDWQINGQIKGFGSTQVPKQAAPHCVNCSFSGQVGHAAALIHFPLSSLTKPSAQKQPSKQPARQLTAAKL